MNIQEKKDEIIAFCRELIGHRSYSGEEGDVAKCLQDYMASHGYTDVLVDDYGNVIGHIKGNRPGPKILFDGHMDTVPVTEEKEWIADPYSGKIIDGKLYGRGTSDMKGALAAMTLAAGYFRQMTGGDFPGDIYVAGIVHEECFEGVAARAVSAIVQPDYVIIGEASQLNLKIGQRGRAEIVIETFGTPAHSANPEKGNNAVYQMMELIRAIREIVPPEHPVLGKGILELTDVKSSPYPGASVVPSYCRATYDRRLLVGETRESVLEPIQRVLDSVMEKDPSVHARVSYARGEEKCYTGGTIEGERFFPGWLFEESDSYVQKIKTELERAGYTPAVTQYHFCTNGSHYAGEAGIKTIGLGPSGEELAHTINEYIEVDQLIQVTECYTLAMRALLQ